MPRPRLPTLTTLRFFAAALVVLVHLQTIWPNAVILQRGEVGVSFFYVLSGFILTWAPSRAETPVRFYRRRFARIFPVHILTWVIAIIAFDVGGGSARSRLGEVLSLPLLQAWDPPVAYAANGVAWSLSVEVLFYACFPLLIVLLRRAPVRGLWALIGLMVATIAIIPLIAPPEQFAYIFPLFRLPEFVVGVALSLVVRSGWRPPIGLLPAGVIAAAAVGIDFIPGFPEPWVFAAVTIVPFALLIAAACSSDLRGTSRLSGRTWVRLGEWSFALFMTHQIVIRLFGALVPDHGLKVLLVAPLIALCVGIAAATFYLVEKPLERRLRGAQAPLPVRVSAGGL